jgi:hypothetical protein
MCPNFYNRMFEQIRQAQRGYELADSALPQGFILITMARFTDAHYSLKEEKVQIQAWGNWERGMSPPSIFEFIITQLLRQAIGFAASSVSKSIHLGTTGCLFDFTPNLDDARYKALQPFVCSVCRERLKADGLLHVAEDVLPVLGLNWLGNLSNPRSPASIVAKLGYNLFLTQGIKPTWGEVTREKLRDEGIKQLVKVIAAVLLAGILLWLGLRRSEPCVPASQKSAPTRPRSNALTAVSLPASRPVRTLH